MSTKAKFFHRTSTWTVIFTITVLVIAWRTGISHRFLRSKADSQKERAALYESSIDQIRSSPGTWPKTEAELLRVFWKNIALNNLKQATIYCPGSKESDYTSYTYLKTSEQVQIGTPHNHPRIKNLTLWPMKVEFARFGDKTIKLAIKKTDSGQLIIDGQNSIWW